MSSEAESAVFGVGIPDAKCKFVRAKGKHLWMRRVSKIFGPLTECAGCGAHKEEQP